MCIDCDMFGLLLRPLRVFKLSFVFHRLDDDDDDDDGDGGDGVRKPPAPAPAVVRVTGLG